MLPSVEWTPVNMMMASSIDTRNKLLWKSFQHINNIKELAEKALRPYPD